jgi:formate hydrogenlyase subunit 6/NADH:ubiquinone oxidoreductase subunit I
MILTEPWQHLLHTIKGMSITLRRGIAPAASLDPECAFRGLPTLRTGSDGKALCTACGLCAEACPTQCISLEPFRVDGKRCMYCGICAIRCPENALEISDGLQVSGGMETGSVPATSSAVESDHTHASKGTHSGTKETMGS